MDCQTALETLDCIRPNTVDGNDTVFADAAAHASNCQSCSSVLERFQELDIEISRSMTDVAVPEDLQSNILSRLASDSPADSSVNVTVAGTANPISDPTTVAVRPHFWRRTRHWFAATAVVLTAAWLLLPPSSPQFTLDDLRHKSLANREPLQPFDAKLFETRLPSGWANHRSLMIAPVPWGVDVAGSADHDIAGYNLNFHMTRRSKVSCHLVIVPKENCLANVPTGTFSTAVVGYVKIKGTKYATVAWSEGEFVYVLFVHGSKLEAMQRGLEMRAA